MKTAGLFLFAAWAVCCQTLPLPARFALDSPEPAIVKPAQAHHFIESVGRRAAILGTEDGTFEAWINPIKVLHDFRLSVYFDGSLEPLDLSELSEQVAVSPGRVTIVHSHAAFTIRQTWVALLDRPALLVLLDVDTNRPLRIRATFIPDMKPMWPASFGGQSSSWEEDLHGLVLGEGLRRYAMVVGSPLFGVHSEQIGHQLPGRQIVLEMELKPELCRGRIVPIVIAGSREAYRAALAGVEASVRESDAYYRSFENRTVRLETPDRVLNDAFRWAKFSVEKGWACNEGVGCGLIAGWGLSGETERPGFGWYFGGDALMNSWSIVDYGDFPRARGTLEFMRDHQRADGKMEHELTQSAALLDWSQYPYGYYHADTTAHYIFAAWKYVARSGDLEFLRQSWESIEKAYRYCARAVDSDGLLSNAKAGAGAVETGALTGKVANDIYLQGTWMAALDAYVNLSKLAGKAPGDAEGTLRRARAEVNRWYEEPAQTFAFARLKDGSMYRAQSSWQGMALAFGGLDEQKSAAAAAHMGRPELATGWGLRLFSTDSPFYDPLSYNDGSVWPFVTNFAIMAEFRHHQAAQALKHLQAIAATTGLNSAGFIPEYMSGERRQALPHAVPHQLFSSAAVIQSTVSGLLGLDGNATTHSLTVRPHLPQGWTVRLDDYRVGGSTVSGTIAGMRGEARISLTVTGDPLKIQYSPAFPAGSRITEAHLNGGLHKPQTQETPADVHASVDAPAGNRFEASIRAEEPAAQPAK
ncbi:MAG: GH116 family glycosyl hydrolase [Bryobacteraceae bacterium]